MLIVTKRNDDFTIKCKYHISYIRRLRKVGGGTFDKKAKIWIFPLLYFKKFEELFKGEIVYNTPRWVLLNEKPPDYSKMYKIDNSLKLVDLKYKLFKYQEFGVKYILTYLQNNNFFILADAVGLGKTIETIDVMEWLKQYKSYKKFLIICKKSLKTQWVDEINKFSSQIGFYVNYIYGNKRKRQKAFNEFRQHENIIVITNYDNVKNDTDFYESTNWDFIIIDEAHILKNPSTQAHKAIEKLKAKKHLFLTGTPIMSYPGDLYGVVSLADRKYFGTRKEFDNKYIFSSWTGRFKEIIGFKHLDELRDKVQSFVLRRTEYEVKLDLPKGIYKKIKLRKSENQEKLLKYYKEVGKNIPALLQIIADDPRVILKSKSQEIIDLFGPLVKDEMSPKTEALIDLLQTILDAGQKAVVFCKYTTVIATLYKDIRKLLKVNVAYYTGKLTEIKANEQIQKFKQDDYNILLASTAIEEGKNLQFANHLINYDQPTSWAKKTQRIGRIRRAGSKYSTVYVYDLITIGSQDVKALEKIRKDRALTKGVVEADDAQRKQLKKLSR